MMCFLSQLFFSNWTFLKVFPINLKWITLWAFLTVSNESNDLFAGVFFFIIFWLIRKPICEFIRSKKKRLIDMNIIGGKQISNISNEFSIYLLQNRNSKKNILRTLEAESNSIELWYIFIPKFTMKTKYSVGKYS